MRAVEVLSNGVERGRRVKSQAEFRGRGVLTCRSRRGFP